MKGYGRRRTYDKGVIDSPEDVRDEGTAHEIGYIEEDMICIPVIFSFISKICHSSPYLDPPTSRSLYGGVIEDRENSKVQGSNSGIDPEKGGIDIEDSRKLSNVISWELT
ncbi:hypothetical protein TREMEDRAFT_66164 [Tremella mesenterica DSM 1558]|uniref:uncharacterized protein n=1 Tax=Tremella mesenterica (strain ATCC 24925 / CBS 8224 / DSM 1558 / NBRC 9311 / NRRL Y-6157 / RJB 2259-6 / UBC 559-6) TaxID=578456 RepID=UPI00032CEE90|nr:uncharacterized protein TREMEDRAFT_66164 [Tremella mesenterica DSM 1558]EIW65793.1 hypothetical protein TREMEDRAFT_66164 [Tremella mesenterica DSM 1558]